MCIPLTERKDNNYYSDGFWDGKKAGRLELIQEIKRFNIIELLRYWMKIKKENK